MPTLLQFPPTYELLLSFPEYKLIPVFPLSLSFLIIVKLQECLLRQKNGYKTRYTHTHIRIEEALLSLHFLLNSAPGLWLLVSAAAAACKHHPNGCCNTSPVFAAHAAQVPGSDGIENQGAK